MRMPRLDFAGARHHVMNRARKGELVFEDDDARALFLSLLEEFGNRFGVRVHGYALMPNHYHLMLESVRGEMPRAMRFLGCEFTRRLNRIRGGDGAIFRGRYHNRLVGDDAYWAHLLVYLHGNPARAGYEDDPGPLWTSHRAYLGTEPRPAWLTTEELQAMFGSDAVYKDAFEGILRGDLTPPADFDPQQLWAPGSTGVVAVPDLMAPSMAVADALALVAEVTGMTTDEVLTVRPGRTANHANWLAAWWMSRQVGLSHGRIARVFQCSQSAVSRRIRNLEERRRADPKFTEWIRLLRLKQHEFTTITDKM